MTTGNRSRTALGAARIALLAGVSAAALLAIGSATALPADVQGVVNPPFVLGDVYNPSATGPVGVDLTTINIPGVGVLTPNAAGVLENQAGTAVITQAGTPGALNANGTSIKPTYASEKSGTNYVAGTGANAGSVLTNSDTGAMVTQANEPVGLVTTGAAPAGYAWTAATTQDPTATALYKWVPATYTNDPAINLATTEKPTITGTAAAFLLNGSTPVTATAYTAWTGTLTTTQATALALAASTNLAAYNAELTALGSGWQAVSGATHNSALTATTNYTGQGVITQPQGQGYGTVATNQGANASTFSFAGGVVYANNAGLSPAQYTAIGPDGLYSLGGTATWTDGINSTTTITNGQINSTVVTGVNQGSTTIVGANTTITGPVGGTFGTTTTDGLYNTVSVGLVNGAGTVSIANSSTGASNVSTANGTLVTLPGTGSVVVGGTPGGMIGVGVATPTGFAGIGSSTAGGPTGMLVTNAAGTKEFLANSSGYISAEGNRIQDVAAPIAGTDAANKAYVDKGVNKAYEGTAIALAISQPVFLPGQSFAMRAGWGGYEGQNAFGVSAAGVVARDVFGYGSTVALDGGVGVGGNYNGVAGKAGVTIGFGGGMAPLAPMK